MELYKIILSLIVVLSTEAECQYEAFQFLFCSDTDEEFFIGYNGEELWYADPVMSTGVLEIPSFSGPMTFAGFYERSINYLSWCNEDFQAYKEIMNTPPEMDAPQTSIYTKDDVSLGVQNTLVCFVTGFYPPSLNISWVKNDENVTEGFSISQYRPKDDGTYNIYSSLTFTPTEGDVYSCTVNHRALSGTPQVRIWDVDVAAPSVGPAVLCGVGVAIGLLGVAFGTYFFIDGTNCN